MLSSLLHNVSQFSWLSALVFLAVGSMSGILRATTGCSLGVAALLSVLGGGVLVVALREAGSRCNFCSRSGGSVAHGSSDGESHELSSREADKGVVNYGEQNSCSLVVVAAPVVITVALALTALFLHINGYTLRTNGNADAAFHIRYLTKFEQVSAASYHGFVIFYTLCIFVKELFTLNFPLTHLIVLAYGFFLVSGFFCILGTLPFFGQSRGYRYYGALIVSFIIALVLVLPLYNQFFLQGGYVHTFGALVYPLLILAYSLSSRVELRIITLGIGIVMLRFMYGLNLPDCALGCAIVIAYESASLGASRAKKALLWCCSIGCLGVATGAFIKLMPLAGQSGTATEFSLPLVWCHYIAGIALAVATIKRSGRGMESPCNRALVCAWALVRGALGVQRGYFMAGKRMLYYMLKHPMYPLLAMAVIFTLTINRAVATFDGRLRGKQMALVAVAIILLCTSALTLKPIIDETYTKRSYAFARQDEWRAIDSVLLATGRRFGGYLAPSWPAAHYINEGFGRSMGLRSLRNASLDIGPETCVFWPVGVRREELRRVLSSLRGESDKILTDLDARFEAATKGSVDSGQQESAVAGVFAEQRIRYLCPKSE